MTTKSNGLKTGCSQAVGLHCHCQTRTWIVEAVEFLCPLGCHLSIGASICWKQSLIHGMCQKYAGGMTTPFASCTTVTLYDMVHCLATNAASEIGISGSHIFFVEYECYWWGTYEEMDINSHIQPRRLLFCLDSPQFLQKGNINDKGRKHSAC